jgi:2-polyprenyl-6-methoxyphenol hydroxylase-like FAD-dependent oxidoreductase
MNVLASLDLAEPMRERGTVATVNCGRSQHGRILGRWDNGSTRYGEPSVSMRRSDLAELLASAIEKRKIPMHFEKRLVGIDQTADRVVAHFADGTSAEGTLLIGADGIRSATRNLVFPGSPPPQYVGIIGLGGFTPLADVPEVSDDDRHTLNFTFGQHGFFGYTGARPGELMWWSNIWRATELSPDELRDLDTHKIKRELLDRYRDYHAPIAKIIANSGPVVKQNILDIATLPEWHRGRVLLIGDASHAVSPNAGQGASMALEDAMLLAKLLRDTRCDHEHAFGEFERERRPRVEKIVVEGRRRGADKQNMTPFKAAVRNVLLTVILRFVAERANDWIYRYKLEW